MGLGYNLIKVQNEGPFDPIGDVTSSLASEAYLQDQTTPNHCLEQQTKKPGFSA